MMEPPLGDVDRRWLPFQHALGCQAGHIPAMVPDLPARLLIVGDPERAVNEDDNDAGAEVHLVEEPIVDSVIVVGLGLHL